MVEGDKERTKGRVYSSAERYNCYGSSSKHHCEQQTCCVGCFRLAVESGQTSKHVSSSRYHASRIRGRAVNKEYNER